MAKKHKAKSEHMRRRIMRRHISLIIGAVFVIGTMTAETLLGDLGEAWLGTPAYYGLMIVGLITGFGFLWVWLGTGEKTETDELEERMEHLFRKQTLSIDRLTKEIKRERKQWYAKFKQ